MNKPLFKSFHILKLKYPSSIFKLTKINTFGLIDIIYDVLTVR